MNPLDQLADIHLPPPVGLWPLAWGWWLLISIALAFFIFAIIFFRNTRKKNAYRKQALNELKIIQRDYLYMNSLHMNSLHINNLNMNNAQPDQAFQTYLQNVNQLLRRCALYQSNEEKNLSLTGEAWLQWLEQQCSSVQFMQGPGRLLISGPYQARIENNPQLQSALQELIARWIKKHTFKSGGHSNV